MSVRRPSTARCFPFAALAALGMVADARAQAPAPDIGPAQIRFITPSASSSSCVGRPTTPMCGIETLIGCASYVWNEGCAAINSPVYDHVRKNIRVEYVIVNAGFVNKDRVRAAHEDDKPHDIGRWSWLREDAFQARFWKRECPADRSTCEGIPWGERLYTISPHGTIPQFWWASSVALFDSVDWFAD